MGSMEKILWGMSYGLISLWDRASFRISMFRHRMRLRHLVHFAAVASLTLCIFALVSAFRMSVAASPLFVIPVVVSGFLGSRGVSYASAIFAACSLIAYNKSILAPASALTDFINLIPALSVYLFVAEFSVTVFEKLEKLSFYERLLFEIEVRSKPGTDRDEF